MKKFWRSSAGQEVFRQETKLQKSVRWFFIPGFFLALILLQIKDIGFFAVWRAKSFLRQNKDDKKGLTREKGGWNAKKPQVEIAESNTIKEVKEVDKATRETSLGETGVQAKIKRRHGEFLLNYRPYFSTACLLVLLLSQLPLLYENILRRKIQTQMTHLQIETKVNILPFPEEINVAEQTLVDKTEEQIRKDVTYRVGEADSKNYSQKEKLNLALSFYYLNDWQNYNLWLKAAKEMDPNERFFLK